MKAVLHYEDMYKVIIQKCHFGKVGGEKVGMNFVVLVSDLLPVSIRTKIKIIGYDLTNLLLLLQITTATGYQVGNK